MAATKAGSKRGRAWEDCEDVDELKQHLSKQAGQIEKLTKDNADLKKALAGAEGKEIPLTAKETANLAEKSRNNICRSLEAQMVYRKQANRSRLSTTVPNLTLAQVKAVVGPDLEGTAKNGPKKFEVAAGATEVENLFGYGSFSKSLRYGAVLQLSRGLTFSYDKTSQELKVSGFYEMSK